MNNTHTAIQFASPEIIRQYHLYVVSVPEDGHPMTFTEWYRLVYVHEAA